MKKKTTFSYFIMWLMTTVATVLFPFRPLRGGVVCRFLFFTNAPDKVVLFSEAHNVVVAFVNTTINSQFSGWKLLYYNQVRSSTKNILWCDTVNINTNNCGYIPPPLLPYTRVCLPAAVVRYYCWSLEEGFLSATSILLWVTAVSSSIV